jgi:hypothetical protein
METISLFRRVAFVSDRKSYLTLRCHYCDTVVTNVPAPTEDKCDVIRTAFIKN